MKISLVAAMARNGVIGRDNAMPWRLPEDLQHFKRVTLGAPVVMGRLTWDSLPPRFRPLPGRRNIVITRNAQFEAAGAETAPDLASALARVADAPKVYVIGGASVYAAALPFADELVLTEIDADFEADTYFPTWDRRQFRQTARADHQRPDGLAYSFVTYTRNKEH